MARWPIRTYADTSIYGGIEDEEFAEASLSFFSHVHIGRFQLVISAVVSEELAFAPTQVRAQFDAVLPRAEIAEITPEAQELQQAYLDAGILTPKWQDDALHVALATVSGCKMIVSWNFRHIVHFQKIPQYNGVNALRGYDAIAIHSPLEIPPDEEEV